MALKEPNTLFDDLFRAPIVSSFNFIGKDHYSKTAKKLIFSLCALVPIVIAAVWAILIMCGFNEKYKFD